MSMISPRRQLERLGTVVMYPFELICMFGELLLMLRQVLWSLLYDRQRKTVMIRQMYRIGYESLPVVLITGVSMGLVLAVQGYSTLRQFKGESASGGMINYSLVTQIMPVMVGLTLAGRVGSSIAAEIGSMKVSEQISALRVMGTNPVSYLVAPRFMACVTLLPLLTAIGVLAGMGSAAALIIGVYDVNAAAYWFHSEELVDNWAVVTGMIKPVVYGAIIALVSCRKGLLTDGGASGVGEACTRAVVASSMLILVMTFIMTVFFEELYYIVME